MVTLKLMHSSMKITDFSEETDLHHHYSFALEEMVFSLLEGGEKKRKRQHILREKKKERKGISWAKYY